MLLLLLVILLKAAAKQWPDIGALHGGGRAASPFWRKPCPTEFCSPTGMWGWGPCASMAPVYAAAPAAHCCARPGPRLSWNWAPTRAPVPGAPAQTGPGSPAGQHLAEPAVTRAARQAGLGGCGSADRLDAQLRQTGFDAEHRTQAGSAPGGSCTPASTSSSSSTRPASTCSSGTPASTSSSSTGRLPLRDPGQASLSSHPGRSRSRTSMSRSSVSSCAWTSTWRRTQGSYQDSEHPVH